MTQKIPSWRTTSAGIAAIVVALASAFKAEIDGDPATVADYGATVAAIIAGLGLLFARDARVTSEQQGIAK